MNELIEGRVAYHGILLIIYYTLECVLKNIRSKGINVSKETEKKIDSKIRQIFIKTIELQESHTEHIINNINRFCGQMTPPSIIVMISAEIIKEFGFTPNETGN